MTCHQLFGFSTEVTIITNGSYILISNVTVMVYFIVVFSKFIFACRTNRGSVMRVSLCRLVGSCYGFKKGWNQFRSVTVLHILKIPVRHCLQNTCKFCDHIGEILILANSKSHCGRVLWKRYERFKICIESKWDGKHVLNFVEFQNVFAFFRISNGLSWMLTAFGEIILETMLLPKRMQTVRTNENLSIMTCFTTYESRKTRNERVMKFVSFGQQQKIYVMGTLVTELRSVYGN